MPGLRSVRALWRMPWHRRARLVETLLFLSLASLAVRWLPFRTVMRLADELERFGRYPGDHLRLVDETRWGLEVWARRVPWRAVCFQIGLASHVMLRIRGAPSTLHYGVRQTEERGLQAHVWVTCGDDPVVGVEESSDFSCLVSSPPATGAPFQGASR